MRMMPTSLFNYVFPDKKDPVNPEHYLCRYCGKTTIDTRRRYYCSDECYDLCQRAVSWVQARRATWERDNKKCVICGKKLNLYSSWYGMNEEDKSKEVAEIHHIIPITKLRRAAVEAVYNDEWNDIDQKTKDYWWARFYCMLFLDINNLTTLCVSCHNVVHAADYRKQIHYNPFKVAPTKWHGFWKLNNQDRITKTLDQFIEREVVA